MAKNGRKKSDERTIHGTAIDLTPLQEALEQTIEDLDDAGQEIGREFFISIDNAIRAFLATQMISGLATALMEDSEVEVKDGEEVILEVSKHKVQ